MWHGLPGGTPASIVPSPAWDCAVPGPVPPRDPTSWHCAHTFYLGVWDRVINGWWYLHYADYHKSVTIMLPDPPMVVPNLPPIERTVPPVIRGGGPPGPVRGPGPTGRPTPGG